MVLVAPDPVRLQPWRGGAGTGSTATSASPAGSALLAALRGPAGARPCFDGLAGGLRAWLEDAAFVAVTARGEDADPLMAGARRLLGPPAGDGASERPAEVRALARLVRALFRQLVTVGIIGDPLNDALDALRADGGAAELVRGIEALARGPRTTLARAVEVHASHLRGMVPRFDAGCMPRTDDHVTIPLAGGRVVLGGVFDLLFEARWPQAPGPSPCAIGLTVDGPRDRARWTLHYLSLLEMLRTGAPPGRLALLDSAAGTFAVEDVREEHLRAVAAHVAGWLAGYGAREPVGDGPCVTS